MSDTRLIIGNHNYSSWSLRGWLALKATGVPFELVRLPMDTPEFAERIGDLCFARPDGYLYCNMRV